MPSTMPLPVALLIAPHLNPYELLQAARVNRAWYASFMSDAVWQEWDVYGVENNIAKHYLSLKSDFTADQWSTFNFLPLSPLSPFMGFNWYRFLAVGRDTHRARAEIWLSCLTNASKCVLEAMAKWPYWQGVSFLGVKASNQEDKQLVYALLEAGLSPRGLNTIYSTDAKAAMSTKNWLDYNYFSRAFLDRFDCVLKLVQDSPTNYAKVNERFRQDKEIFKAHIVCHMSHWQNCAYDSFELTRERTKSHQTHRLDHNPLEHAPTTIKQNKLLMIELVKKLPACYAFLSDALKLDHDIVVTTLRSYGPFCNYCMPNFASKLYEDKDFVVKLIGLPKVPMLRLEELPHDILLDLDVVGAILKQYQGSMRNLRPFTFSSGPGSDWLLKSTTQAMYTHSRILTLIASIYNSLDEYPDWTNKAEQVQFALRHCLETLPKLDELKAEATPKPEEPPTSQPARFTYRSFGYLTNELPLGAHARERETPLFGLPAREHAPQLFVGQAQLLGGQTRERPARLFGPPARETEPRVFTFGP